MSNYNAQAYTPPGLFQNEPGGVDSEYNFPSGTLNTFWMRARDNGEAGVVYRSWSSTTQPDLSGTQYSGPLTGALVDIVAQSFSPAKAI